VWGGNNALTSLTGLENLTSIGGNLKIDGNDALISLTGLDKLTSIGGDLWIRFNDALSDLSGLDNVTSINKGDLKIVNNDFLISISGLENIDCSSINNLDICDNISLSTCEVQSVCDYLLNPGGTIEIHDNALGCNSPEEVEEACTVSVGNINPEDKISIFPNPANRQLTISIKDGIIEEVFIYNISGQSVIREKTKNNIIDISELHPGMYIIELVSVQKRIREKLMVK